MEVSGVHVPLWLVNIGQAFRVPDVISRLLKIGIAHAEQDDARVWELKTAKTSDAWLSPRNRRN